MKIQHSQNKIIIHKYFFKKEEAAKLFYEAVVPFPMAVSSVNVLVHPHPY